MITLLNVECRADGNCYGTERLPSGSGRTHSFTRSQIGQYNIQTWSPNTVWRPQTTNTSMTDISNTVIRPVPTLQAGIGSLALPTIDIKQHFDSRQTEINQRMTEAQRKVNADTANMFTQGLNSQLGNNTSGGVNLGGAFMPMQDNPQPTGQGIPSWAYYAAGAVVLLLILFLVMKK